MPLVARVIENLTELQEIASAWTALLERCGGGVFRTPEWHLNWLRAMGPEVEPAVLVIEEDSALKGVLPMIRRRRWRGPLRARTAELAGTDEAGSADHVGLVCLPAEHEAVWQCVSGWLAEEMDRVELVRLSALGDGRTVSALRGTARREGWMLRAAKRDATPYCELPDKLDAWERSLSPNRRQQLRRRRRRLFKLHPSAVFCANEEIRCIDDVLADIARMSGLRWRSRGSSSNLVNERSRRFLRAFCHSALDRGWLRLHQLYVKERMVAGVIVFHWGEVASYFQLGWDLDYADLSVGDLILYHSVERAIDEGLKIFDFLRGHEPYKARFGARMASEPSFEVATRFRGRMILAGKDARSHLVRLARRALPAEVVAELERIQARLDL